MGNNSTLEGSIFYEVQALWSVLYLRERMHLHHITVSSAGLERKPCSLQSRRGFGGLHASSTPLYFGKNLIICYLLLDTTFKYRKKEKCIYIYTHTQVSDATARGSRLCGNLFKSAVNKEFITPSLHPGSSAGCINWTEQFSVCC